MTDAERQPVEPLADIKFEVMIGGGQIDETARAFVGADAFGLNAVETVSLCRKWMELA
jgi:5-methyltetrahydrofolate--homocysteine methyltransferase